VADPDGNPIAGARCQAIGAMGVGATAVTDADGQYVMRGQSTLVQMVVVRAPGYVQDALAPGRPPQPDARGDIVIDVTMLPAATVTGRVVGPDGKPLAGAQVKSGSTMAAIVVNMLGVAAEGVTNAAGRYVLDGVRPGGKVRVLARHAGFLDGQSEEFQVQAGTVNDAPDLELKRGSKIRVTVTDPGGKPLAKARVEVSVSASAEERVVWDAMAQWRSFADVRTGKDGAVVVERLPRGNVTLTATHDDHAGVRKVVPVERLDGGEPTSTEVTLQLREAYVLRGRVVDDEGNGVADVNLSTSAAPGARAEPGAGPETWIPTQTAKSGADGRFAIGGLPDEAFVLHAMAEGFKNAQVPVATPRADVEVRVVRVSADAQKRLQEIQRELMQIYQAFATVKDDAERQVLLQRMRALQAEQAKLQGDDGR
jgi:protocatechuate 3,4-dioxygenase beta subunit